jgi:hypothetical protein
MSSVARWDNGGWNVICDACGRQFKDHELQLRWDGLMVCRGDWEPRQPQDFVHGVADKQAPPFTRPEQADVFIPINYTQYPAEQIDLSDKIKFSVTKNIKNSIPVTTSVLNGAALNQYRLNYSDTTPGGTEETVSLNETVRVILGRNLSDTVTPTETVAKVITKRFSDTISIAESLQFIEVERTVESLSLAETVTRKAGKGISETLAITESVSTTIVSPLAFNGAALNTYRLD